MPATTHSQATPDQDEVTMETRLKTMEEWVTKLIGEVQILRQESEDLQRPRQEHIEEVKLGNGEHEES